MVLPLALLGALLLSFPGHDPLDLETGPKPVQFRTADGILLHAWYVHSGAHQEQEDKSKVPVVIALHMFRHTKESWQPLIDPFRRQGIALLLVDMRGHGESKTGPKGEDLTAKVEKRDRQFFLDMHQDAAAAVAWLRKQGHRKQHIGLLGASVGCSVAIDACRRDPELQVTAVLTPGSQYLGVPTLEHLKNWGTRSLLVVSSREEARAGAEPILKLFEKQKEHQVESWFFEQKQIHGTRMFGKVEAVEDRLATWFAAKLNRSLEPSEAPAGDHE
ncbi:MAG: hypothetical protein DWQ01_18975 [Planctomycetota bacterium]|nr:MAG: hypothetical protein DWQ01_18975 [Planctomycetota bacterium]